MDFKFSVNLQDIQNKLGQTSALVQTVVKDAVEKLSISTHAFILNKANAELTGYKRDAFLGKDNKNVKWVKISNDIWVVEIDPSAKWVEEGRPATSMATEDWLLKPGKTKRAKDGSLYRVIPFTHEQKGAGAQSKSNVTANINTRALVKEALQANNMNLNKVMKSRGGDPIYGSFPVNVPPSLLARSPKSAPRSPMDALKSGLKSHEGIPHIAGLTVIQRPHPTKQGKTIREAVTFRVVSSKHQAENRWMYPEVKPFNSIPQAYEYAKQEWEKILHEIEVQFGNIHNS